MRAPMEEMEDGVFKVVYARQRRPSPSPGRDIISSEESVPMECIFNRYFRGAPEVYGTCVVLLQLG